MTTHGKPAAGIVAFGTAMLIQIGTVGLSGAGTMLPEASYVNVAWSMVEYPPGFETRKFAAWKTAVPTAASWSWARTGRVKSGSSVLSGSFCVATPSQSSSDAVNPAGSAPLTGAANFVAPMGASDAASHFSASGGIASSDSRSVIISPVVAIVVYGAIATTRAP